MKNVQELIHWIELGAGARWIRRAAVVAATLALSLLVAFKQFHGPTTESTLVQADVGRQLAGGHGFTTLVNYPQTAAVLEQRGVRFRAEAPYPELHHAPLYSVVVAAALRVLPGGVRDALFGTPPAPPDGFGADYFLLGLNLVLLWTAAALTYSLGRKVFDAATGWLAALALLVSVPIWQDTVSVNGTPLLMVLLLGAFQCWWHVERAVTAGVRCHGWVAGLGAASALLFLTEYSAGAIVLVAIVYLALRFRAGGRWIALGLLAAGFLPVAGPWLARNIAWTGHPVALAVQNVALKAGDPTAEPATVRASLQAQLPVLDLKKFGNKTLTTLQEILKSRIWSGGALWLTAFFAAGWLYTFRGAEANRLRWVFTAAFGVLLVSQAALNSGESDRHVATWSAPLIMIFGAGFFRVLVASNAALGTWPRSCAFVLLGLQALPLLHDVAEPRRLHFQYPPYFPGLFQTMRREAEPGGGGTFGIMADVPAGVAWYGGTRAWAQPTRLRDFYAVTLVQPIGQLLLTPRTLDRPFFSELNARPILPGTLSAVPNRFGDWGAIYAGLLTGNLPREFPLSAPQKLAENLYVLLNPALPASRGK